MCKYSMLAKNVNGAVRWCHDCQTFNLSFNNFILNFTASGFQQFKANLTACYTENAKQQCCRTKRDIVFNTRLEGMQLLFSTAEVGALLSLMQEAALHEISFEVLGLNES